MNESIENCACHTVSTHGIAIILKKYFKGKFVLHKKLCIKLEEVLTKMSRFMYHICFSPVLIS